MRPHPLRLLVTSPSDATLSLLSTMLSGFYITALSSIEDVEAHLQDAGSLHPALDFIIVDHQYEPRIDQLAQALQASTFPAVKDTKIIHMYTPTSDTLSRQPAWGNAQTGVVRMTKPPRKGKLLQMLAELKDISTGLTTLPATDVSKAMDDLAALQRTLYGNVLVAEGWTVRALTDSHY